MTIASKTSLQSFFQTGDQPTSAEFNKLIDTLHRDPLIAYASAAEGGKTGVPEITATAAVTLNPVGAVGRQLLNSATTASAAGVIGGGTIGQAVFNAGTTASALSVQGGTTLGRDIFTVSTTASAQAHLGGGAAGEQIYGSVTTASAQSLFGIVPAATTAQANTKTNTSVAMTPANMAASPFAPRAYVAFTTAGTIRQRQRVSSVTKRGTGTFDVKWSQAMPTANYVTQPFTSNDCSTGGDALNRVNPVMISVRVSINGFKQTTSAVRLAIARVDNEQDSDFSTGLAGCTVFCSGA